MKPGLTGLWQVSARSDPKFENRVRFDLHYVNNWSLLLDAKILARTIPVVVLGEGGKVNGPAIRSSIDGASHGHDNGTDIRINLDAQRRTTSAMQEVADVAGQR